MRVFKFGGASVKDAGSVKNVVKVLEEVGHDNTLLVVSAMGKTTNAMEDIVNAYFKDKSLLASAVHEVVQYHDNILHDLFPMTNTQFLPRSKLFLMKYKGFGLEQIS